MASGSRFTRGALRGTKEAIQGTSHIVEGVHQAILDTVSRAAPVPSQVPLITGMVYRNIRAITGITVTALDRTLTLSERWQAQAATENGAAIQPWQLNLMGALNGAFGDHFRETGHPWDLGVHFCRDGAELDLDRLDQQLPLASPHLCLLVHGLSMTDLSWRSAEPDSYARALESLGATALELRYNSGLPIHENGLALAWQLQYLADHYPAPLQSLHLTGHSMGGLLILSACHQAIELGLTWPTLVREVACLGAPHQGARLELAGNWASHVMNLTPYTTPFAMAGRRRSAGIKDLRYGSLRADDRLGRHMDDTETFAPGLVLPVPGARYLMVAGSLDEPDKPVSRLLGDGLVLPQSALSPRLAGEVDISRRQFHGLGHLDLQRHESVQQAILDWHKF
ncbi:hypothetical protein [uncultured Marinobacter sp.]|uniref:esterase/lipase family protein n=1 Tax=uncultured Marinobacter sp. TaxID=187379 RepID=UPI0030DD79C9